MSDCYSTAAEAIHESEAVIIVASNGLSISEGLNLFARDEGFTDMFPELVDRHGVRSIISSDGTPSTTRSPTP